jgi:hypothetical protein
MGTMGQCQEKKSFISCMVNVRSFAPKKKTLSHETCAKTDLDHTQLFKVFRKEGNVYRKSRDNRVRDEIHHEA